MGDVQLCNHGMCILIKWNKTRQTRLLPLSHSPRSAKTISAQSTPGLLTATSIQLVNTAQDDQPLLADPTDPHSFLTASQVPTQLKDLCQQASLSQHKYTPHSFRRGGAAFLFKTGLSVQDIKHHGLWVSSAVEVYLRENYPQTSRVVQCFQQQLA